MDSEKKLYPMRFCSIEDKYSWGSETFNAADLGYKDSLVREGWLAGNSFAEIMDTYMDRISGDYTYELFGRQFPICIRTINVSGKMPLRAHPDDTIGLERYDCLGKEKLWYILKAEQNAKLLLGWNTDTNASEMLSAFEDEQSLEAMLNTIHPQVGEVYRIKPGTVHGASGEIKIVEISQASPLDFCMHSWGEVVSEEEFDSSLKIIDALDFIDYKAYNNDIQPQGEEGNIVSLLKIPAFEVKKIVLDGALRINNGDEGDFSLYYCLNGEVSINTEEYSTTIKGQDAALVPSECAEYIIASNNSRSEVLEISLPRIGKKDSYLNQNE